MQTLLSRKPTKREIDMVVEASLNALPEGIYAHQPAAQFVSLVAFAERFTPLSNLAEVAPVAYRHNVERESVGRIKFKLRFRWLLRPRRARFPRPACGVSGDVARRQSALLTERARIVRLRSPARSIRCLWTLCMPWCYLVWLVVRTVVDADVARREVAAFVRALGSSPMQSRRYLPMPTEWPRLSRSWLVPLDLREHGNGYFACFLDFLPI